MKVKHELDMPKIVDKVEKKEKILEAAIRIFAKKGLTRSTISEIAVAAGIGKGTVYEYFDSKLQIFSESFRFFMDKTDAGMESRLALIPDPLDRLRAYILSWNHVFSGESLEYLEIYLLYWAENLRRKDGDPGFDLADMYTCYRGRIRAMLDECIEKGRIKRIDTNVAASLILGSIDGLMIQWIMDRSVFDIEQALDTTVEIFIDGLKASE